MPPRRTFDGVPGTACCACCAAELAYYRDKEARKREQTRLYVARHRARKPDGKPDGKPDPEAVSLTPGQVTPSKRNPPTPPVSRSISKEIEKVGRLLEPLTVRGYEHDPDFWAELAATYPAARLAVEAYKIAGWFKDPAQRNRKVKSWPAFLDNWVKKAQRDADADKAGPAPPAGSPKGVVVNGTWHPPAAFQRNPGPPEDAVPLTAPLETFTPEEIKRLAAEHARVPFKDRLAAKAALATNGVHKA